MIQLRVLRPYAQRFLKDACPNLASPLFAFCGLLYDTSYQEGRVPGPQGGLLPPHSLQADRGVEAGASQGGVCLREYNERVQKYLTRCICRGYDKNEHVQNQRKSRQPGGEEKWKLIARL